MLKSSPVFVDSYLLSNFKPHPPPPTQSMQPRKELPHKNMKFSSLDTHVPSPGARDAPEGSGHLLLITVPRPITLAHRVLHEVGAP